MNLRWVGILFLGIGVGLGACSDDDGDDDGGDGGGGSGGSGSGTVKLYCLLEDNGEVTGCDEHMIPEPAIEESRDACTSGGGMVVDSCPSAGRVGRCSLVMGALVIHYYEPDDPVEGEEMCVALNGTWTSG